MEENKIQKWMFYHCPKNFSWIVYQNLESILHNTKYQDYVNEKKTEISLTQDNILYIHSVYMTDTKLIALIEARDGFYLVNNEKNENNVNSITSRYSSVEHLLSHTPKTIMNLLEIKKASLRKMTQEQSRRELYPFEYSQYDDLNELLNREISKDGHLDLSYNFTVTSEHLFSWEPKYFVNEVTFNTCYQFRDFKWLSAEWVKDVTKLTMINMTQLTNQNVEFIVNKMSNLKELYLFTCPQIDIRVILGALKLNRLETLCLHNVSMNCQPNQYSGLIAEEEWELFRNRSLKKLLVNSMNLSLDIIDYLRQSLLVLENLIIDESKFKYLHENLVSAGESEQKINIISNKGKRMKLSRDFYLKNLFKHRFSKPFSDSMLKVMERIYEEEGETEQKLCQKLCETDKSN